MSRPSHGMEWMRIGAAIILAVALALVLFGDRHTARDEWIAACMNDGDTRGECEARAASGYRM